MIVPGSVNPLMLAMMGGDPLDELGRIERSIRLRRASSSYLKFTPPTPSTCQKITFSFWVKRGELSLLQSIFGGGSVSSGYAGDYFGFAADDTFFLCFDDSINGSGAITYTAGKYRDPVAHLHVVLGFDTTQTIQANRATLEINGAATSISNNLSQNAALYFMYSATATPAIGVRNSTTHIDNPFGGFLSHFACVVGQKLTASLFGRFHPRTGQWRPKSKAEIRSAVVAAGGAVRKGWGANGFFLPFDDPTSLTTLGYDRSQSDTDTTGNNWTPTNISLTAGTTYDSMLDTPTNNFWTLNPLDVPCGTISDCGMRLQANALTGKAAAMKLPKTGKWRWMYSAASNGHESFCGIKTSLGTILYYAFNGGIYKYGVVIATAATYTNGDEIYVAYDADAATLKFYKGTSLQATVTGIERECKPAFEGGASYTNVDLSVNFGQRTISHEPTLDYKDLCTKNLPFPKIQNPKSAFVAVIDTGANIAATLASARAGWSSYIDIIKRRDAAEGWRWIFYDDPANYLDSSSTAAKAVVPSFSGTAYVGYSLKVNAANGVTTGRLAHVNGVADVVPDGLSNSRKMVILKSEASGTWYVYHPDLTAGKLLYLEQAAAETTDATLGTVLSNSFLVAAALASGTYRWIAIAETAGFISLGSYVANTSNDGPFGNCDSPSFVMMKNLSAGAGFTWPVYDSARSKENPTLLELLTGSSSAETLMSDSFDKVSNGFKIRARVTSTNNVAGNKHIYLSIAAYPFRYANAR